MTLTTSIRVSVEGEERESTACLPSRAKHLRTSVGQRREGPGPPPGTPPEPGVEGRRTGCFLHLSFCPGSISLYLGHPKMGSPIGISTCDAHILLETV